MIERTDFRAIGVGASGKRTVVHTPGGEWGEAVRAERDQHGVFASAEDGFARRLGPGDELYVHDESGGVRRFDHDGTEIR